jgi:hypothetical protein
VAPPPLPVLRRKAHRDRAQSPRPAAHGRHAGPQPAQVDEARLAIDVDGRPSMYSQAQDSAEVKGLTLQTDPFALHRELGLRPPPWSFGWRF